MCCGLPGHSGPAPVSSLVPIAVVAVSRLVAEASEVATVSPLVAEALAEVDELAQRLGQGRELEPVGRHADLGHLRQLVETSQLTLRTAWSALVPSLATQAVYTDMLGAGYVGSSARELFNDVIDELDRLSHSEAFRIRL